MKRFTVDEVVAASDRLPTLPASDRYRDARAFGGDPSTPVIDHGAAHPLLAAVGLAFAQHRPLVLSPDAVWLTIAQGVAQHVRLHADVLRPRLVRHDGRKRLTITTDGVPADASTWVRAVDAFRALLAAEIGEGRARLFQCDFSTSTDVDKLASQIVLLDAYSPYFSLWMVAICGIPEITLLGSVEDWRRIRERIEVIAELDLGFWCRSLVPIADQLVRAANGDVDTAFWRRIYNPVDAYGGELITGWITRLYPYVKRDATVDTRNPMLDLPIDEPRLLTTATQRAYSGPGIRSDSIPATVSRVTVHIVDQATREQRAVALVAGVTAVAQDADGALRPIAGWHLEDTTAQVGEVVERILAEHEVVLANPEDEHRFLSGPAEVMALFSRIETATLFAGARSWRLRRPREQDYVQIDRARAFDIQRIVDLPLGRSLCAATRRGQNQTHWVVCRVEEPTSRGSSEAELAPRLVTTPDAPAEISVLGTSLAAILDAAFASDGEIDHLAVGRLAELLAT